MDDLQQLLDRARIGDVLHAYCRGVDRCAVAEVAALFTDDAVLTIAEGERGTVRGRDVIERRLTKLLGTFTATSHHLSNIQIELTDEHAATASSYLFAWHRFVDDRPDGYLFGRYVDRLVRFGGRWLIAARTLRISGEHDFPFPWVRDSNPRS